MLYFRFQTYIFAKIFIIILWDPGPEPIGRHFSIPGLVHSGG